MRVGIVEGEPGIFPDPIARFLRRIFRTRDAESVPPPPAIEPPDDAAQA
jgi:hypothetical protein